MGPTPEGRDRGATRDGTISQRGTRKGRLPPSEVIRPNLSENRSQDLFMLASVITKISRHTLTGTGYAGLANKTALVAGRLDTAYGMIVCRQACGGNLVLQGPRPHSA